MPHELMYEWQAAWMHVSFGKMCLWLLQLIELQTKHV